MKKLLLIALLLSGCTGSLVDHTAFSGEPPNSGSQGDGGDAGGTDGGDAGGITACDTATNCTTPYPVVSEALCISSDKCSYRCLNGKMKCATGCCDATAISAGAGHTCAVANGEAHCWGQNDKGQLGRDAGPSSIDSDPPAGLPSGVVAIAAGGAHTCALVQADGVYCWGDNTSGQLGNGQSGPTTGSSTANKIAGSEGALLIAAGDGHSCYATASKTFCWGRNSQGQIGNGNVETTPRVQPTEVIGVGGAVDLAAGDNHTCAVDSSDVLCWGANDRSQVGNGGASAAVPTPVVVLSPGSRVGLGANHSCAASGSDGLSCWGANLSCQVDNSCQDRRSPNGVLSNVLAVAGGTGHTCAIRRGGGVTCWGLPSQLGVVTSSSSEQDVVSLTVPVQAITARSMHTCVIQTGAVMCWGSNDHLELGIAAPGPSTLPVLIDGR